MVSQSEGLFQITCVLSKFTSRKTGSLPFTGREGPALMESAYLRLFKQSLSPCSG